MKRGTECVTPFLPQRQLIQWKTDIKKKQYNQYAKDSLEYKVQWKLLLKQYIFFVGGEGGGHLGNEEVVKKKHERKDILGRGRSMFKDTEACKFLSCLGKGIHMERLDHRVQITKEFRFLFYRQRCTFTGGLVGAQLSLVSEYELIDSAFST